MKLMTLWWLCDALIEFSELSVAYKNFHSTGWNELCKDTYHLARQAKYEQEKTFRLWNLRDIVLRVHCDTVELTNGKLKNVI